MKTEILGGLLILAALTAQPAFSQDADSIMQQVRQKQLARWNGVDSYVVDQTMGGNRTVLLYEKFGNAQLGFQLVPPNEVSQRLEKKTGLHPDIKRLIAGGILTDDGYLLSLAQKNLPLSTKGKGVIQGVFEGLFVFLDSATSLSAVDDFYSEQADENRQSIFDMAEFGRKAGYMGTEKINGRKAYLLWENEINRTQKTEGGEYTLTAMSLWVDAEKYVPLRMKIDGVVKEGKKVTPITIERIDSDYKSVGGLYESFKRVMRLGGMMDDKQIAELQEAREDLEELKEQIAAMPKQQRDMIMARMGPQMDTMEKMAAGAGVEVETTVNKICIGGVDVYLEMLAALPTGADIQLSKQCR